MKNHRQENVHTDFFTPRTYQVELLDAALQRNTIVCLGTGTGKTFVAVMLIKELAHQVRHTKSGSKKCTVFLVNTVPLVEQQAKVIRMHTDLQVCEYVGAMNVDLWSEERWVSEFQNNQVLVMTAQIFLDVLLHGFIGLSKINLLVFDECHHATKNHPYVQIMKCHDTCPVDECPRILGLTASILNNKCNSPAQLDERLSSLEKTLRSTAETASDMIITDLYSARPKEIIIECDEYIDETGLVGELDKVLVSAIDFLVDVNVEFDKEKGEKDPRAIPKTVLIECHNILHILGPWCAGKIAETLAKQLTTLVEHEPLETCRQLLQLALTQLNMIQHFVNVLYDTYVQTLEDFLSFMSPRVHRLLEILHQYKPDDNFMIIGGDDFMDEGSDSDDSLNLSEEDVLSEEEGDDKDRKKKSSKAPPYVAVKCVPADKPKEDESLCGIVFVYRRHTAYVLNKLIVELCNWDLELFFVRSQHITGHGIGKPGSSQMMFKTQEEVLRQFRHRDINLLISTSVLEEGVDVPKCSLIIRFDLPQDYRSYVQSKGRARAPKSKYYMLVEHNSLEAFSTDLKIFKGIESILMSKCHSREDHMEEEEGLEDPNNVLPPYMPVKEDGAPRVTMTSAIALVNKYCAKLPSDAFTHLTPKCHVEQLGTEQAPRYQASLQLPINSPIKKPILGAAMATKKMAKMAVALKTAEILHKASELDDHLLPVGKEMIKYEDEENEWEDHELQGQARPGTTKRKQYYEKKIADALIGRPTVNAKCYLYYFSMTLTCPITEEQNTRGRKIHGPNETPRGFGIISEKRIPLVPLFPVFTRSGEITVSVDLITDDTVFTQEDLPKLTHFHRFVFTRVLRLEKDPMTFDPDRADSSYIIVPLLKDSSNKVTIDWDFLAKIELSPLRPTKKKYLYDPAKEKEKFEFKDEEFKDAVVMPSYRNIDQPQYFYVAEIRHDLNPKCPFPSPELYDTFEHYYTSKYGLEITNLQQPLLDVDHTSARLNLLTPRYMNQKGVALPTSSAETRRARRENLQQKQILIPELCDIHPFPASLWRKAVCLPAIMYRMNYLLIAEELRLLIAEEAHIGIIKVCDDYRFPDLEFGFSTKPGEGKKDESDSDKDDENISSSAKDKKDTSSGSKDLSSSSEIADYSSGKQQLSFDAIQTSDSDPITHVPETTVQITDQSETSIKVVLNQANGERGNGEEADSTKQSSGILVEKESCNTSGESVFVSKFCNCSNTQECNHHNKQTSQINKDCSLKNSEKDCLETEIDGPNDASTGDVARSLSTLHIENTNYLVNGIGSEEENTPNETNCSTDNFNPNSITRASKSVSKSNKATSVICNDDCAPGDVHAKPSVSSSVVQGERTTSTLNAEGGNIDKSTCPFSMSQNVDAIREISERMQTRDESNSTSNFSNSYHKDSSGEIKCTPQINDEGNDSTSNLPNSYTIDNIDDVHKDTRTAEKVNDSSHVLSTSLSVETSGETVDSMQKSSTYDVSPELHESGAAVLNYQVPFNETNDTKTLQEDAEPDAKDKSKSRVEDKDVVPLKENSGSQEEEKDVIPLTRFDQVTDLKTFVGPSPCTILQTLTMSNANDFFNLERLETIGDSFLKFAITVYLYCTYPGIHEGKLSYLRSKQVSNYNLYKLGKKKSFPDCMVAAKFEPTENWLPPGYVIKKEGAFKGLSVRIASKLNKKTDNVNKENSEDKDASSNLDNMDIMDKLVGTDEEIVVNGKNNSSKEEIRLTGSESASTTSSSDDMQKRFNKELHEATCFDEERTDPRDLMKCLIPYNLQTQHSLPDKSIADCVEALIGCYLTTCGQRAALQFMSWLGLKVLPDGDEEETNGIHHGNNLRDILQGNSIKIGFANGTRNKTVGFGKLQPPHSPLLTHVPKALQILGFYLDGYDAFEEKIRYRFNDRSYLLQAFTHASYHYNTVTDCYQRLEFLGDAILDYVITRHLFEDVKKHSPGILTDLRSALVNNNIFAALAVKWDFHKYFKAVSPQLFSVIEKFVCWQKDNFDRIELDDEVEEDEDDIPDGTEDIEIPKALGDIFESVAGAIYLDSGMSLDVVWRVYYRMMKPQIDAFTEKIPKSPVRELLEMEPETAKFEKPERTLDGKIRVTVNVVGKGSFRGIGRNYRIAKSAAAKRALKHIKTFPVNTDQSKGCHNCPCQRMKQQITMHMHT